MVRCALFGTCFDALIERILFFTHLFEHDFIFNILPDRQGNADTAFRLKYLQRSGTMSKKQTFPMECPEHTIWQSPGCLPCPCQLLLSSYRQFCECRNFMTNEFLSCNSAILGLAAFTSHLTLLAAYRLQARFPHQAGFSAVLTCCPLHVVTCHFYDHAQN